MKCKNLERMRFFSCESGSKRPADWGETEVNKKKNLGLDKRSLRASGLSSGFDGPL